MEWFGTINERNAWPRGVLQGAFLATFYFQAIRDIYWVWPAVFVILIIMTGEYRMRGRLRKMNAKRKKAFQLGVQQQRDANGEEAEEWKRHAHSLQEQLDKVRAQSDPVEA